mgnify:CR=1 FL=1
MKETKYGKKESKTITKTYNERIQSKSGNASELK